METNSIRPGLIFRYDDIEPPLPPPPPPPPPLEDVVDPPDQGADHLFAPLSRPAGPATTLLTEDAGDGRANCLDRAVDLVNGMTPAERQGAELVILDDTRPGAEGSTGHVVVRQGNEVIDPTSGKRYANTGEYLAAHPGYREAGTLSADRARAIFETSAGSPERARAIETAGVPPALQDMLLADAEDPVKFIKDRVDGFFTHTSEDDLRDINDQLEKASPEQLNELITQLEKSGTLKEWMDQLGGAFEGLPGEEKRELFDLFARALKPEQMTQLTQAVQSQAPEALEELNQAVMAHATAEGKAAYVKALSQDQRTELLVKLPQGEERNRLLETFAANLEGGQLAELAGRVSQRTPHARPHPGDEITQHVIQSAPSSTKLEYIKGSPAFANPSDGNGLGSEDQSLYPRDYRAEVLASMASDPAAFAAAVKDLGKQPHLLRDVLASALKAGDHARVESLLLAGKASGDLDVKVNLLQAGTAAFHDHLNHLSLTAPGKQLTPEEMANRNRGVIALGQLATENVDAGALIGALRARDPEGRTLVDAFELMLTSGDEPTASAVRLAELVKQDGSPANAGYFRAALDTANESLKADIDSAQALGNITAGVIAGALVPGGWKAAVVGGLLAGLGPFNLDSARAALDEKQQQIRDSVLIAGQENDPSYQQSRDAVQKAHGTQDRKGRE